MIPLDDDMQFMLARVAELLHGAGLTLTTDESHNRIIVDRPNAAEPGVVIIEFRGE